MLSNICQSLNYKEEWKTCHFRQIQQQAYLILVWPWSRTFFCVSHGAACGLDWGQGLCGSKKSCRGKFLTAPWLNQDAHEVFKTSCLYPYSYSTHFRNLGLFIYFLINFFLGKKLVLFSPRMHEIYQKRL